MNSLWTDYCRQSIKTYITENPENKGVFKRRDLINRYRDEWFAWRKENNYECNEGALGSHVNDTLAYLVRLGRLENLGDGWYKAADEL